MSHDVGSVMRYGLMWQGNECEAVVKALVIRCEKVKGLRVLPVEIEKRSCDVWRSPLLCCTVFRL